MFHNELGCEICCVEKNRLRKGFVSLSILHMSKYEHIKKGLSEVSTIKKKVGCELLTRFSVLIVVVFH